ncbi:MAG: crotonase/enoyl-CoA hydratase family protein, partial [Frankiales bacterium]|nr:crotonase/enoyl-CoA hydratase family protein [Frankiales bacterium]
MAVHVRDEGPVRVVVLDRPEARGAVDGEHAVLLAEAFEELDARADLSVGILTGSGGHFCSGADLKAVMAGKMRAEPDGRGPMGPTRLNLSKPVIAAIEGHAVAGGLELALWCDLRVAAETAVFGVYCRRWGVPLIDGGTVRLPRLIGTSRAMDLILTGRSVDAAEA